MIYDLIVIGDDLSSYVAAATAAARGLKTALLAEIGMGDNATIGGVSFNIDCTPLPGFVFTEAGNSFLKQLNIAYKISLLDPGYQVILPGHRIDFFHDKNLLVQEIIREFPEVAAEVKSFYDSLETLLSVSQSWLQQHPRIKTFGLNEYFDYLKLAPDMIKNRLARLKLNKIMSRQPAFRKVVEAQQCLLSFHRNHRNSIFSFYPLFAPLLGVGYFPKGKQTIFEAAVQKVMASGGLYLNGAEALSIKKGKPFEITYNDSEKTPLTIEAYKMIVSTKWQNMHLLIDKKKKINFGDWLRPAKISHCPFTLHLGVKPHALPEKMARHVAVVSDVEKDIYDDNLMVLCSCADNDKDLTASTIPFSVTVFLPNVLDAWTEENLTQKAEIVLNQLEFFLPFLRENIEFYDLSASIAISKKHLQLINSKYQVRNAFLTGLAAKGLETRFKNIYLTGASLLLDIGYDGEILSGINAAYQVLDKEKRHDA